MQETRVCMLPQTWNFQAWPSEMFMWVQVRTMAGPCKNIHRAVHKTLLHCLCCVLRISPTVDAVTTKASPLGWCRISDERWLVSSRHDVYNWDLKIQSQFKQATESCFSKSESPLGACLQTSDFHLFFTEEKLPSGHSALSPDQWMLQWWLSLWKFLLFPYRISGAKGSSPPVAQFSWMVTERVLVVSHFFHLIIMEPTVLLGTFIASVVL